MKPRKPYVVREVTNRKKGMTKYYMPLETFIRIAEEVKTTEKKERKS